MRINIFTAIPLGVYLHKVENQNKGGWEEVDDFLHKIDNENSKAYRKAVKVIEDSKSTNADRFAGYITISMLRGTDIGLDLMLLVIDILNAGGTVKEELRRKALKK